MASTNVLVDLLEAQAHLWNHIFSYINSMALKCALQLGIPEVIHKHNHPITLPQLADALLVNKLKSHGLYRLMRILVHSNFFHYEGEAYSLTTASRLLLRDNPHSLAPFALVFTDPIMMDPFHHVSEWFRDECLSPFVTRNGTNYWEFVGSDGEWNRLFNEAMTSDGRFVGSMIVKECKHVFEGLKSVVDVAGGSGAVVKTVAEAVPGLECIVLELPHVVAAMEGLSDHENVRFVSGDMFEFIPPADACFLKWIMHGWNDEKCVKILEKCKEAVIGSENVKGGKVIIVDMVVDVEKEEEKGTGTQLFMDMVMMAHFTGKERSEKEWAKVFEAAGFKDYKITPVLGTRSVIEVFP
ncbi:8-hydroxyquercetin 8-O-methyltransferase-like [Salvia splendens]|uniref:8-hydroxyquercetin 8-O-methyltransferase-like n=1 Tax=Salvia splendens TaxID=180675 RepID=UPI0011013C6B|nr:8-hydroxyquercetin 8-O-methyltransferase-like [Salvia splendens]